MGRAAWGMAAGGQAATAAAHSTDQLTMRRVRDALLGQLGGVMPARPDGTGCGDPLPRRVPDPDVQRAGTYAGAAQAAARSDEGLARFDPVAWLSGGQR